MKVALLATIGVALSIKCIDADLQDYIERSSSIFYRENFKDRFRVWLFWREQDIHRAIEKKAQEAMKQRALVAKLAPAGYLQAEVPPLDKNSIESDFEREFLDS